MGQSYRNADAYILRCIREKKISVDCGQGKIFSQFTGREFKQMVNWAGYHYLDFKFFGERRSVLVHRIVYLAKHGAIIKSHEIDHIDRDTSNNRISNLRMVTRIQNMQNSRRRTHAGHHPECPVRTGEKKEVLHEGVCLHCGHKIKRKGE